MGQIKELMIEVGNIILTPPDEWMPDETYSQHDDFDAWQNDFVTQLPELDELPPLDEIRRQWYFHRTVVPMSLKQCVELIENYNKKNDLPLGLTELDGEVYYRTTERLFVLRTKRDEVGNVPCWALSDWIEKEEPDEN